MPAEGQRRYCPEESVDDVFGMIASDLVFQLLLVFLVASLSMVPRALQWNVVDFQMAKASHGHGGTEDAAVVIVSADGQITVEGKVLDGGVAALSDLLRIGNRQRPVRIVPDGRVPAAMLIEIHEAVANVTDQIETLVIKEN